MMLPFSIFRAAVFAEPSVTKIEEVIGLVHGTGYYPGAGMKPHSRATP